MTAGAFVRACAALVLLCACGAAAATRPAMWGGLRTVGVECLVQTSSKLDAAALETALCERVLAIVARDAPVPVKLVKSGDSVADAGTVILRVQGNVERSGDGLGMSFSIRAARPSSRYSETSRGSSPSRIEVGGDASLGASLDPSLTSALAELLPWKLQRPEIRVLTEIH